MAMAPERIGIGIRRHFTTAGVHPYDEVEWERRDARITNFRDGSVAFEQLGVEVPTFWSQNATNILTQKYFRGQLGTPERETSLKQVADRVADTIADWGIKDGYFTDEGEAAAFRDELKYLIVHQRAAFNSPVWFNIGVSGVPQQASACQPWDALVSTPDGLVPIGRLVETNAVGAKVFDAHGLTRIVAVKANGSKSVLRIHTKAGHRLDVTADHLVWRSSLDTNGEFVPVADLRVGDRLAWHGTGLSEGLVSLPEIERIEDLGPKDVYDIQTESGEYLSAGVRVHNCFILAVEDTMDAILDWYKEEGTIFKGGSGSGINLSQIRSSKEHLKGGGTASGPVSFMRGADASAGTIKSGGKTRRAAKMVILNADHPDIEDFIWCKAIEERKARALSDAGFDMDLDGRDSHSIQYQNANNSVRVSDAFMQAVLDDADWYLRAVTTGEVLETVKARDLFRQIAKAAWECADPGMQFDTTINKWHTAANTGRINGSNPCSEYVHLDNSACNLASINLLRFLNDDDTFDVDGYKAAIEVFFTAQEILVGNADYPTEKIDATTRRFRQLGLGYANLGALLMALGLPYDSDEGRAYAAALTALLTGHAYATSARTAMRMGPFAGYTENREHMNRVLRMHRAEVAHIDEELVPTDLLCAAQESWDAAVEVGEAHGVRNSQATVLAPTGCLVGGSLIATSRGLVRLRSLGDVDGNEWQDLDVAVQTDGGPKRATKFFVNGLESVVDVRTDRGYRIQGTTKHRIKVVHGTTGEWEWRRFDDVESGDLVPLALNQLVGDPQTVPLPPLPDAYWTSDYTTFAPREMTPDLAELIGYFMGDGSLHARGLRFCVSEQDGDVVDELVRLGKECFGLVGHTSPRQGYTEVRFDSVRLVLWWEACGFAKRPPVEGHRGKGYVAHIPDAVLHSNDRRVYGAFLRGLFEADGTVTVGYPHWMTTSHELAEDVQALLLALGLPTTRTVDHKRTGYGPLALAKVRPLNLSYNDAWLAEVGFISARKDAKVTRGAELKQAARMDHIPMTRAMIDRLCPENGRLRRVLLLEVKRGTVSRRIASELYAMTDDPELGHLLSFFYDRIESAQLAAEELTYDISVPENVTYYANGFVSHNTISFLLDCDTTGIEPDLGLVKSKKLVGGGNMKIVNQTVPRALRQLGYPEAEIDAIIGYIDDHDSIVGAPHFKSEHLLVFACSMGDNTIHYSGHVRMMGAVQPFISGAISKCIVGDSLVPTNNGLIRIGSLYDNEVPDSFRDEIIEVASVDGLQKSDAFYYGGVRPVREVRLRSGHRVTGTRNHRLLVAGADGRMDWKRLDEIEQGDAVAVQYGADLWSTLPSRLDGFVPGPSYGSQKAVQLPTEMTTELAFLLGAYAAEGNVQRSVYTIKVTNSVPAVLDRVMAAWRSEFGLEAKRVQQGDKCPEVHLYSKTVVEFLEWLGCGGRASEKRIPDAVLRSTREHVLAFLQGLALDAYVSVVTMPKWAICLDSGRLLDDLQAVLTNLGVVHSRISKYNRTYDKSYDEVYATGAHAQRLAELVPFMEPEKSARVVKLQEVSPGQSTADVIPGLSGRDLYDLLPRGRSGRNGHTVRTQFSYLCDTRTAAVSRRSLERVAAVPRVDLPQHLRAILDDNIHFSPVVGVEDAEAREVFDLSIPATHAFVANGIVNHNTVNVPEEVTVEDVEQLHIDAWRLGLKAVAIYRDNCKVAQPLSTTRKGDEPVMSEAEAHDAALAAKVAELEAALDRQTVVVKQPLRERLPRKRRSMTFKFRVADCEGYATVGEYDDGRPGEVFMQVSKQGSTLAGIMDAFAVAVSLGLQHGVPLATYVRKYTNMRFEPAGITDDPDLRIASSLVDYIFRRLAVDYLSYEERVELGILTSDERTQPTLPGIEESTTMSMGVVETPALPEPVREQVVDIRSSIPQAAAKDAPYCYQCGNAMQRAGSCFVCTSCGTTSGCS